MCSWRRNQRSQPAFTGASGLPAIARTRGSRTAANARVSLRPWISASRRSPTTDGSRGSLEGSQCDNPPLATTRTRTGSGQRRIASPSARPRATHLASPGSGGAAVFSTSGTNGTSIPPVVIS
ncbi:hypothetical protein GCM10010532_032550 [Dactylosporangium siamense]|uniref:Uncharacterized protein n=1 Tax=Dactylosporangium siamense TaxID=685454 RepID=A0A919U9I5_9ACTN|nr:hypothetical protein Dsi01nite_018360 [Dactylosporangium siamense]